MIEDRLEANGVALDLDSEMALPITFSINDFKEPNKRKRTTSTVVTLKGTATNRAFFAETYGYHSTGNNVEFNPMSSVPIKYYKSGQLIISDGVLQLQEVSIIDGLPTFKVQIFSESVDIFLTLSNIKVSDLDWSDLTHTLSRQAIKNSWNTPSGFGYRYPLIQWRALEGSLIWNTTDLIPYVHAYDILIRCFDKVGVTFDSYFIHGQTFKNLLFGFGGGDYILTTTTPQEINARKVSISNIDVNSDITYIQNPDIWERETPCHQVYLDENTTTSTVVQDITNQFDLMQIRVLQEGNYKVSTNGQVRMTLVNPIKISIANSMLRVRIYKNNTIIQQQEVMVNAGNVATANIQFSAESYFVSGDIITIRVVPANVNSWNFDDVSFDSFKLSTPTKFTLLMESQDIQVTDGSMINISRFIPDITCADFVMGIFRQFNLVMSEPNEINNVVTIDPLVNFYSKTNQFDDITSIVDYSKPFIITPTANTVSKNTIFEFKKIDDSDSKWYLDKHGNEYGNFNLVNSSQFAPKNETKISLPWGTIIPKQMSNSIICPRFILEDNGVVKPNKGASRLVFWNGLKNGNWTLKNTKNNSSEPLSKYPCIHHFDDYQAPTFDLNFTLVKELRYATGIVTRSNSYSKYYESFFKELISPHGKSIKCFIKIDNVWVKERDFSRLKMINGSLFKMNTLGPFDSNKASTTQVELVRILDGNSGGTLRPVPPIPPKAPTGVKVILSPEKAPSCGVVIVSERKNSNMHTKLIGLIN